MAILTLARSLLILVAIMLPLSSLSQGVGLETRIKATFLYKFCQYVTWPAEQFESADSAITIAVVGDAHMADELEQTVAGRLTNGRPMVIKQLKPGDPLDGIHILFIGSNTKDYPWKGKLNLPLLTVTESLDENAGGIINFVVENNKVRFDITRSRAERLGLHLSSQLLSVARHVREDPS